MNTITKQALKELINSNSAPCVSIYMPTSRPGPDSEQNLIRFKNLVRQAEQKLTDQGMRAPEAKKILEPTQGLLSDSNFWRNQSNGLAVFVAKGLFRHYEIPIPVEQRATVADHFHITPLLPLFMADGLFYILALSKRHIRLYQGTRSGVQEVALPSFVPTQIDDYLKFNEAEAQVRYHSVGTRAMGAGTAIFHGQGVGTDDAVRKRDLVEFFRMLDRNLMKVLNGDRSPMVLAGVEYERTLFREISDYPSILEGGISGSPEMMSGDDLHRRAWALVEPHFRQSLADARAQMNQGLNTRRASQTLQEVLPAAVDGRVEILFVTKGPPPWGRFDFEKRTVERHEREESGDQNLQDLAAIYTLSQGGAVYVLDSRDAPLHAPLAAVFRY